MSPEHPSSTGARIRLVVLACAALAELTYTAWFVHHVRGT